MDLRDASLGFYRVWYAGLGARHGLLRLLAHGKARAPEDLARETGLDGAALARWCRGAHALGLLDRTREGRYKLRAEHRATLADPEHPDHLGHHFEYLSRKSLHFGDLDALLRGKRSDADLASVYALATRWDHLAFFERVLPREGKLREALARGVDVLDMGAGEGGWTLLAARRFPRSRFVAADVDEAALARAAAAFREAKLPHVRARPMREVEPGSADVVFLGEVLTSPAGARTVLRHAHDLLRPGGRLVALEGLLPPAKREPRGWGERLILAMDLDFGLDGSAFLGVDEAKAALKDVGFARPRVRDLGGSLFALQGERR